MLLQILGYVALAPQTRKLRKYSVRPPSKSMHLLLLLLWAKERGRQGPGQAGSGGGVGRAGEGSRSNTAVDAVDNEMADRGARRF